MHQDPEHYLLDPIHSYLEIAKRIDALAEKVRNAPNDEEARKLQHRINQLQRHL